MAGSCTLFLVYKLLALATQYNLHFHCKPCHLCVINESHYHHVPDDVCVNPNTIQRAILKKSLVYSFSTKKGFSDIQFNGSCLFASINGCDKNVIFVYRLLTTRSVKVLTSLNCSWMVQNKTKQPSYAPST